jgi:hypothetical protein
MIARVLGWSAASLANWRSVVEWTYGAQLSFPKCSSSVEQTRSGFR